MAKTGVSVASLGVAVDLTINSQCTSSEALQYKVSEVSYSIPICEAVEAVQ